MSIDDAIGHLKVIDDEEQQSPSGAIIIDGKLHLTWE